MHSREHSGLVDTQMGVEKGARCTAGVHGPLFQENTLEDNNNIIVL